MNNIKLFLVNLRASLWFVPGLMIAVLIGLAILLIEIDSRVKREWLENFPRFFGLGADGSRGMLTAIASSMLTVAALAFSLTLSAVSQASAQFTPRIFRNFMRDRANQFILGYFVGVFAYCLIILRTIRGGDEIKFVPSVAVMVGLALGLGGILVLIFFIHHIAASLQITTILDNITDETKRAVEKLFPAKLGEAADKEEKIETEKLEKIKNWRKIPALNAGYVQSVNTDRILEFATENAVLIRLRRGIGQFTGSGATLAEIAPDSERPDFETFINEERIGEINDLFSIDRHRTINQDAGFGIRQIVDIALKALSPGVNDTTTAISCIDNLGEILGEIAGRKMPEKIRLKDGVPRVVVVAPDFDDFVETAFDQIRISGKANQAVFERLLDTMIYIAGCVRHEARRRPLERQVGLIGEFAAETLQTEYEKEKVRSKMVEARTVFEELNEEEISASNSRKTHQKGATL